MEIGLGAQDFSSWYVFRHLTILFVDIIAALVRDGLDRLRLSTLQLNYPVELILLETIDKDVTDTTAPLLSIIHGGPHGASLIGFDARTSALALSGCMRYSRLKWIILMIFR
jgi:hypothetical protein